MSWTAERAAALPRIAVLATGGTIAGVQEPGSGLAYRAGAVGVEALLAAVPAAQCLARLQAEAVAAIGSQDMTAEIWLALARRIGEIAAAGQADGVVITHGTDTLEETAWFLHLACKARLPVVLTGAMRPGGAPGADGPANLVDAIAVAASGATAGWGPVAVMNGQIHGARGMRKINAHGVCAFASPNGGALGEVAAGSVILHAAPAADGLRGHFAAHLPAADALPRVDIVCAHVGQDPAMIDWLVQRGARGIVLAGFGAGNASQAVIAALARASQAGVAIVRASGTGSGLVLPNGEVDDARLGFVAAYDLSPQKARILLMLALAQDVAGKALQDCFGPA